MNKKHIIFDLDDTLTDAFGFNQQMFVDTFKPYLKLTSAQEKFLRQLHTESRGTAMINQFTKGAQYLKIKTAPSTLVQENEEIHTQNFDQVKVFEGVPFFLKRLKEKRKQVSLMTNRQSGSLSKILKNNHLDRMFDRIISSADMGHEKPDPFCLLTLVKESTLPKKKFLYIGDSDTDAKFARNAGVDYLIVDQYLNGKMFYQTLLQTLG